MKGVVDVTWIAQGSQSVSVQVLYFELIEVEEVE